MAATYRNPKNRSIAATRPFHLGATIASLSLLPRRTLLGANLGSSSRRPAPSTFDFAPFAHPLDDHFQELAASAPQKRNWRGILTAIAMIVLISSIILAAIFFLTPCKFN
jgi:hypothetical protein